MGLHGQCSKRVGEMKAGVDAQARYNRVGTRLRRVQSLPERSPAQQGLSFGAKRKSADDIATSFRTWIENSSFTPLPCGVSTPEIKLGRHGPRRDANGVYCFEHGLFLLLLSLEESNQRTLRNRNARFNRHPACRRFRCVQACKAERHPALCTET
jgi:hypothetical protein